MGAGQSPVGRPSFGSSLPEGYGLPLPSPQGQHSHLGVVRFPGHRLRGIAVVANAPLGVRGGGAGDRTRVRSRVPCDIYECSPGFDLTSAAPWDQARLRPASVHVPPGAEAPPGGETACINVGSVSHSRGDGRRQAEA